MVHLAPNGCFDVEGGGTLFADNWYTSVDFAQNLQNKLTHLTGTIRKNGRNLSPRRKETFLQHNKINSFPSIYRFYVF